MCLVSQGSFQFFRRSPKLYLGVLRHTSTHSSGRSKFPLSNLFLQVLTGSGGNEFRYLYGGVRGDYRDLLPYSPFRISMSGVSLRYHVAALSGRWPRWTSCLGSCYEGWSWNHGLLIWALGCRAGMLQAQKHTYRAHRCLRIQKLAGKTDSGFRACQNVET